jgi:hypothetical protein
MASFASGLDAFVSMFSIDGNTVALKERRRSSEFRTVWIKPLN